VYLLGQIFSKKEEYPQSLAQVEFEIRKSTASRGEQKLHHFISLSARRGIRAQDLQAGLPKVLPRHQSQALYGPPRTIDGDIQSLGLSAIYILLVINWQYTFHHSSLCVRSSSNCRRETEDVDTARAPYSPDSRTN
jgi:hypothetical protein